MASGGSVSKTSEETFEFICSSCFEGDLIREALKYCVECQQYCCQDCLTSHSRISSLKGHSFLDNSSVKPKGQPRRLPAFPTKQCSKHVGMIMYMYCEDHDVVCCCICVAEDHRLCKDILSITDNIDRLYSKTDTTKVTSELNDILSIMNQWQTNTDTLLQQLQDSKVAACKAVSNFRIEMEKFLKKLEETSIKKIEEEYKKLESEILEDRKRYEDSINNLENLKQLFAQASGNIAQLFICTKLAEKTFSTIGDNEMKREIITHVEVKFIHSEELKSTIGKMVHLGEASAISSRTSNRYKGTKLKHVNVGEVNVSEEMDTEIIRKPTSSIYGSCIVDNTILFTDHKNNKLKRFDILSLSLVDKCAVPEYPRGICRVGEKLVAVACKKVVQFASSQGILALSHSIKMNHTCYGIAHNNGTLYITDKSKALYMYDMSGNLLKSVTSDDCGQPLFECSRHITFNDKNDRLFVCDVDKGLVCFNAQCGYIETITDPDVRPSGVCVDDHGNVIVANSEFQIIQCDRDGKKRGIIVTTGRRGQKCVCIHYGLRKMFVGCFSSGIVNVYKLTWKTDHLLKRIQLYKSPKRPAYVQKWLHPSINIKKRYPRRVIAKPRANIKNTK